MTDFPYQQDCTQVFLTWELHIDIPGVAQALGIAFDADTADALSMDETQFWVNGVQATVRPDSDLWCRADE